MAPVRTRWRRRARAGILSVAALDAAFISVIWVFLRQRGPLSEETALSGIHGAFISWLIVLAVSIENPRQRARAALTLRIALLVFVLATCLSAAVPAIPQVISVFAALVVAISWTLYAIHRLARVAGGGGSSAPSTDEPASGGCGLNGDEERSASPKDEGPDRKWGLLAVVVLAVACLSLYAHWAWFLSLVPPAHGPW